MTLEPTWVAVIGSLGLQVAVALFIAGKYSERFDRITTWINEVDPKIEGHGQRLAVLEHRDREDK